MRLHRFESCEFCMSTFSYAIIFASVYEPCLILSGLTSARAPIVKGALRRLLCEHKNACNECKKFRSQSVVKVLVCELWKGLNKASYKDYYFEELYMRHLDVMFFDVTVLRGDKSVFLQSDNKNSCSSNGIKLHISKTSDSVGV